MKREHTHHKQKAVPIIECSGVSFCYPDSTSRLPALENVSFQLFPGEFTGLIGGNGSGKTTLLKIILGILKPEKGMVYLFGEPIGVFRNWQWVGYVPQHVFREEEAFPATVREVVESGFGEKRGAWHFWCNHQTKSDAVAKALETVGMSEYASRLIGELSGGERQRVFIARALVSDPKLLILDEPLTGVDAPAQDAFYKLLKKLDDERNIAILLVSHDLETVTKEVEKLLCLHRTIVCAGSPKRIHAGKILEAFGKTKELLVHEHIH